MLQDTLHSLECGFMSSNEETEKQSGQISEVSLLIL